MNPLMALLQSATINGVGVNPYTPAPALEGAPMLPQEVEPIEVTAPRQPGLSLPQLMNTKALGNAQKAAEIAPERKGMFGVKGTLRDVLGILGDALLVGSGNKPVYFPGRQQEKIADAYAGFTGAGGKTPEEIATNQQAALERLAATPGGAELAQKAWNDMQANQVRQAQAESLGSYRTDQLQSRNIEKFSKIASNMYSGAKTPEQTLAVDNQLMRLAQVMGIDPALLGVTPDMTAEDRRALALGNYTPYQQVQAELGQQNADSRAASVGIAARNADTSAGRAAEQARANRAREDIQRNRPTDSSTRYVRDATGKVIGSDTTRTPRGGQGSAPKGPPGADFTKYEYRQTPDGKWQRRPK